MLLQIEISASAKCARHICSKIFNNFDEYRKIYWFAVSANRV
jgi:hypothetical protein